MASDSKSPTLPLASLITLVLILATGCLSDVGDQDKGTQFAAASAVGLGDPVAGTFQTRSGSEVLLSGKDSDSTAAPLFDFEWRQVVGPGDPVVDLFERDLVSRSFTAPDEDVTLEFELTVRNVDGVESTDTVMIHVNTIADSNEFLRDPNVDESFYLFVSPKSSGPVATPTTYSLSVAPIVYWTGRDGIARSMTLGRVLDISGVIERDFDVPSNPVDASQQRHKLPVPLLDFDEINKAFQDTARGGRLEFEEIDEAQVELLIGIDEIVGSANLEVFVGRPGNASPYLAIDGTWLYPDGSETTDLPRGAILGEDRSSVTIDLENLRQELAVESKASARNYYRCIDPLDQATTLSDWLEHAGFEDPDNASGIVNARYLNNYDLGFGRDMYIRRDEDGNVYSYVVNYPSLESLLKGAGEFATVVMEYSDAPDPLEACGTPIASSEDKIVKFYAYSPNSGTGAMERTLSQNFDGRGERFLPGVCTACHDGRLSSIEGLNPIHYDLSDTRNVRATNEILASSANLEATFMPWDIDSFLFARAEDPALVDPSLNEAEFTNAQLDSASLEAQQDSLRRLNEATLSTYLGDPSRYEAPLRLVHLWYGNASAIADPITDPSNTDALLSSLPESDFDGTMIQPGWAGQETLYRDVFARNCRMCHTQQDRASVNFDTYAEFIDNPFLTSYVFEQGRMPVARLTHDRFWVDFTGQTNAAERLRSAIGAEAEGLTPGQPKAVLSIIDAGATFDAGQEIRGVDASTGELEPVTVSIDGSSSLFTDEFRWSLETEGLGCPNSPELFGDGSSQASLVVDSSPCRFSVQLEALDDSASDTAEVVFTSNRLPTATTFSAPLTNYVPGDASLAIDVLGRTEIGSFGDPPLSVDSEEANVEIDLSSQTLTLWFPPLSGVSGQSLSYVVRDSSNGDGSLFDSEIGEIFVSIPPIEVSLSLNGAIIGTSAELKWTVPPGFVPDSYTLERDGPIFDGFSPIAGCAPPPISCTSNPAATCSCTDTNLTEGETYQYRVRYSVEYFDADSILREEVADSEAITVAALDVPQAVVSSQPAMTNDPITVSWNQGGTTPPEGYRVYRTNLDAMTDSLLGSVGPDVFQWVDSTVEQNTRYQYGVSQFDSMMNESSRTTATELIANVSAPTNPVAATATGTAATTQVDVSFLGPEDGIDSGAAGYSVERREGSGAFAPASFTLTVQESFPAIYSFSDTGRSPDTEYAYRVTATGRNGGTSASDSNTSRTSVSFDSNIAPAFSGGSVPNVATPFNVTCAIAGCHLIDAFPDNGLAIWKTLVRSGVSSDPACLLNPTLSIGDCNPAMSESFQIDAAFQPILDRWRQQGFLD